MLSPQQVVDVLRDITARFNVVMCLFDTYIMPSVLEWLMLRGIPVKQHIVKLTDYECLRSLLYKGNLVLPNHPHLLRELRELQVKGKRIDHPRGGSKDIADCVANICSWFMQHRQRSPLHVVVRV